MTRERKLREALEAMYRMHVRESGHKNGECANCFVAKEVLRETSAPPAPVEARTPRDHNPDVITKEEAEEILRLHGIDPKAATERIMARVHAYFNANPAPAPVPSAPPCTGCGESHGSVLRSDGVHVCKACGEEESAPPAPVTCAKCGAYLADPEVTHSFSCPIGGANEFRGTGRREG